jgi:hypothetical protein
MLFSRYKLCKFTVGIKNITAVPIIVFIIFLQSDFDTPIITLVKIQLGYRIPSV